MTEYELFRALRPLYPAAEYALLPQVANATGARTLRHCDALALSLWPSRGLHLHGFEMKSYRGDLLLVAALIFSKTARKLFCIFFSAFAAVLGLGYLVMALSTNRW